MFFVPLPGDRKAPKVASIVQETHVAVNNFAARIRRRVEELGVMVGYLFRLSVKGILMLISERMNSKIIVGQKARGTANSEG